MEKVGGNVEKVKILNLVLFSHNKDYDDMYELTRSYYQKYNIKTLYYTFSGNENHNPYIKKDILYLPGKESYIPGILYKTIEALSYAVKNFPSYDYIVRSNISTIVNFSLLKRYLLDHPIQYGGSGLNRLEWLDQESGVYDKKDWGTIYASGTAIILGMSLASEICNKKDKIRYDVIDDLAIGIMVKDQFPHITPISIGHFVVMEDKNGDCLKCLDGIDIVNTIFYRNRCSKNRGIDVKQMKCIIKRLTV